jgi:hypothetical protein
MGYFARFGFLVVSILASLTLVWLGLKSYGESQPVSDFETPLVKKLKEFHPPILWTYQSNQPFQAIQAQYIQGEWFDMQDGEAQAPLQQRLSHQEDAYFLIFFEVTSAQALPSLRKALKENNFWERSVLCSSSDGTLQDLRELEPDWTFCSGEIFMTRMLALSSLGLQSLNRIRADIFFVHLDRIRLSPAINDIIKEAQRQNRLTFIGPSPSVQTDYPAQGWVIQ